MLNIFLPLLALALAFSVIFMIILRIAKPENRTYKTALALGLFGGFLILWIEGGVGINGPSHAVTEWIEIGVFSIGILGAILGRFQAKGMSYALLATGLAQMIGIGVAVYFGLHTLQGSSIPEIAIINSFFALIFFGSAYLFRKASTMNEMDSDLSLT